MRWNDGRGFLGLLQVWTARSADQPEGEGFGETMVRRDRADGDAPGDVTAEKVEAAEDGREVFRKLGFNNCADLDGGQRPLQDLNVGV